jgi:hypothetical protein
LATGHQGFEDSVHQFWLPARQALTRHVQIVPDESVRSCGRQLNGSLSLCFPSRGVTMSFARPLVVVALLVMGASGCSTLRSIASETLKSDSKATTKQRSAKEVAACEKMCSVAGNVDDKEAAIDKCKKQCRE